MDFSDSTRIVFNRIQKLEPESATKIIGCLLLQDHGEEEMIRLASAPDNLIHQVIYRAKTELQQLTQKSSPSLTQPPASDTPLQFTPFSPVSSWPPAALRFPSHYWDPKIHPTKHNSDFNPQSYSMAELQDQTQFLSLEDQLEPLNNSGFSNDYFYPDGARTSRRVSEFPVKTCHYFNKGFCKHGSNCRYLHQASDCFSQMLGSDDDQGFSPGSLDKLEMEITEILKSRRGNPISIASLPMIYYEKYGKAIQAEGYQSESQRHGKTGYSLTKLLARLRNSIRLIDRPHGQHAVILAEDALKYLENRSERSDPGPIVSGSRQIYLTFPAESTFTEDDVSNYFSTFGPVEDVRIPCQQKRMFGFVTFVSSDTVKMILTKGNPHFVCGARVLVKPYREKSKLVDRKYSSEKLESPMYYPPHYIDMDSELHSMPRGHETSRFLRKQLMEEREYALELERRRLVLSRKPMPSHHCYFGYPIPMDGIKVSEDHFNFQSAERFSYLLDVLKTGSTSDDKIKYADTNYSDQDSNQGLNLPESPFASPISTVI